MANWSTTGADGGSDLVTGDGEAVELELDALEEGAVGVVGVLLQVDDVAAVRRDERGHGGDDAVTVATGDEQHGVRHRPHATGASESSPR